MIDRLSQTAAGWARPAAAVVLFGSTARGDATPASDLDILVVRPAGTASEDETWRDQLASFADQARAMTGNSANIVEYGAGELRKMTRRREPALLAAQSEGIVLAGKGVAALMRREPRKSKRASA